MYKNKRLELYYRVFVRQYVDTEAQINELVGRLETVLPYTITYTEAQDTPWKVALEDLEKVQEKKYFILYLDGVAHVVVREVIIKIDMSDMICGSAEILGEVKHAGIDLEDFAMIRYIEEILSGKQAV